MSFKVIIALLMVYALICTSVIANVSLIGYNDCNDSSSPICTLILTTSSENDYLFTISDIPSDWMTHVVSIGSSFNTDQQQTTQQQLCSITPQGGGITILFPGSIRNIKCFIRKASNMAIASIAVDNGELILPALAYYTTPFEFLETDNHCSDGSWSSNCKANFYIPKSIVNFTLETTSSIKFKCPDGVIITNTADDVITKYISELDIDIEINRYSFDVSSVSSISQNTIICELDISKISKITPLFNVIKNDVTIFEDNSIILNNIDIISADDCLDVSSSLCTFYFIVPIIQSPRIFKVTIPFFYMQYDFIPYIDKTYQNAADPYEKRYIQRFHKQLTPSTMKMPLYNGQTTSPVYISGTFLTSSSSSSSPVLSIDITKFIYNQPLEVLYNEEICSDRIIPYCRVYYRTKYIGYRLSLTLNALPFGGGIDNIQCGANITISSKDPNVILFSHTFIRQDIVVGQTDQADPFLLQNDLIIPDPSVGYTECIVDYTIIPTYNNTGGMIKPGQGDYNQGFYINSFTQDYFIKETKQTKYILPQLDDNKVKFDTLPFTFSFGPECMVHYTPYCSYIITISSTQHDLYQNVFNLDERQDILNKSHLRSLSIPIYSLKKPIFAYGERSDDIITITTENNQVLDIKYTIDYLEDSIGYDIIHLDISSVTLNWDLYFKTDNNNNNNTTTNNDDDDDTIITKKLDIIIKINFMMHILSDEIKSSSLLDTLDYNIWLLGYNNVKLFAPYYLIDNIKATDIEYVDFIHLETDNLNCNDENNAFCTIKFKCLLDLPIFSTLTPFPNYYVIHSYLLQIPNILIDYVQDRSTMSLFQSIELISNRTYITDDGLEVVSPYLTYNITFFDPKHRTSNDLYEITFYKRLNSYPMVKLSCLSYQLLKVNEITKEEIPTIFSSESYLIALMIYRGDVKFDFDSDCISRAIETCHLSIYITTNDLKPKQQLLQFIYPVNDIFYSFEQLGCIGWDGINIEQSLDIFQMNISDNYNNNNNDNDNNDDDGNFKTTTTFSLADINTLYFSDIKPLHYDTSILSHVTCRLIGYKRIRSPRHIASPLPDVIIGLGLNDQRYKMYRFIDNYQYHIPFPSISYNLLTSTMFEDCRTAYKNSVKCTTQYIINASPEYPLTHAVGNISRHDFEGNPLFGFIANITKLRYKSLCIDPSQRQDGYNEMNIRIDENLDVYVTLPLYIIPGDVTSDLVGTMNIIFPLCDSEYLSSQILYKISPKYQTTTSVSYYYVIFDLVRLYDQGVSFPNVVTDAISFQLFLNYNETDYKYNNNAIMKNPDRFGFSTFVVGSFFDIDLSQRNSIGKQHIGVNYTIRTIDIDYIVIDTLLGNFDLPQDYLNCTIERINITTGKSETVVIGVLSTDSLENVSYLTFNKGNFDVNDVCHFNLEISQFYPTKWFKVIHHIYSTSYPTTFYMYHTYPQYTNQAQIQYISKDDYELINSSSNHIITISSSTVMMFMVFITISQMLLP